MKIKGMGNKCVSAERLNAGARLYMWDCDGGSDQYWNVSSNGEIRAANATNLCIDDPGASVTAGTILQLYPCHGGANQRFGFANTGEIKFSGQCFNVRGGTVDNGSWLQIYPCTTGSEQAGRNQLWHFSGQLHQALGAGAPWDPTVLGATRRHQQDSVGAHERERVTEHRRHTGFDRLSRVNGPAPLSERGQGRRESP